VSLSLQLDALRERGYVVVPSFVPQSDVQRLNEAARQQLAARTAPVEFEADLQYRSPDRRACANGCRHISAGTCSCRAPITTVS